MNIIIEVLKELNFSLEESFWVENIKNLKVDLLISRENESQVFLIIDCKNKNLVDFVDGSLIKEIAVEFRRRECHRAEMDRNTSLLIVCEHELREEVDASSKVKIEDDPYYFKKYVFSYDKDELEKATAWLKGNEDGTMISGIQEYIADTGRFLKYKDNKNNEQIYSFFIELATKLHCFPMKTVTKKNINSIDSFLEEELRKLKGRKKKPIDINREKIEAFTNLDIDFDDIDVVCDKWNSII